MSVHSLLFEEVESLRQQLATNALHGMNREAWVIQLEEKLASRDAEVESMRQQLAAMTAERDMWARSFKNGGTETMQKQVTLLRGIVENVVEINPPLPMGMIEAAQEALATTEPKEGK